MRMWYARARRKSNCGTGASLRGGWLRGNRGGSWWLYELLRRTWSRRRPGIRLGHCVGQRRASPHECACGTPGRGASPIVGRAQACGAAGFEGTAAGVGGSTNCCGGLGAGGARGFGSGIVWDNGGLVLTNAHVVRQGEAQVQLWDGRKLAGRLASREPRRELVALRIAAADLEPAAPGDSARALCGTTAG